MSPAEGAKLPALSQTFILGSVTPGATLQINDIPTEVYRTGGFLAMISVKPDAFTFHLDAEKDGKHATLDRNVTIEEPPATLPETPVVIARASLEPFSNWILAPGDLLRLSFQGSPGGQASFSISGIASDLPMVESGLAGGTRVEAASGTLRGFYKGAYLIQPTDKAKHSEIRFRLRTPHGRASAVAAGKLEMDRGRTPRVGVVTEDIAPIRPAPDGGYELFVYRGMKVWLTGRTGDHWRVRLAEGKTGWVRGSAIRLLPSGTPPPRSVLGNMVSEHAGPSSTVRIPLSDLLPFQIEESDSPSALRITIYGTVNRTDWIRQDADDPLLKRIRWKQVADDACQVTLDFKKGPLWGYDVRYEGSTLVIEVRAPPRVKKGTLSGLTVAVDAGHGGPDIGARGPTGTLEKDVNLQSARVLASELKKRGASVFLTREQDVDLTLYDRPRLAWEKKADLFLSLHCDAAPPHKNPLKENGFSTYYYHPHSSEIARVLHRHYRFKTGVPDRGLTFGDLAVCRMPQMPAVLIEQAFIIVPAQEEFLVGKESQKLRARAIAQGLVDYFASR